MEVVSLNFLLKLFESITKKKLIVNKFPEIYQKKIKKHNFHIYKKLNNLVTMFQKRIFNKDRPARKNWINILDTKLWELKLKKATTNILLTFCFAFMYF